MTLKSVLAKLENAVKSLIANLSCSYCLELLNKPITLIPCGHSFCNKCKEAYEDKCYECKQEVSSKGFIRNKFFDEIISKIQYIQSVTDAVIVPVNNKLDYIFH